MRCKMMRKFIPTLDLRQKQLNNIAIITFWSQFGSYAINAVLILFLTRPLLKLGLGYDQTSAYAFVGVSIATNYLMPVLGGFMADQILGIRRAILLGSICLAIGYLLVMLSGYTITSYGDKLFILAYAMIPATNSLLMGTASALISNIYSDDAVKAKAAMTLYYLAINIGSLLAILIAPSLLNSPYGPLSIFAITFLGKAIAAANFARKYQLYNNILTGKDKKPLSTRGKLQLIIYLISIYIFTVFAYFYIFIATIIISTGCLLGILWFLFNTWRLSGIVRTKQFIAIILIIESIIFFIIYNQMNSTLILFAQSNSDLKLLGLTISPAQFQIINPLLIIILGLQLPRFYARFPQFTIPFQFASGTMLAALGLLCIAFAAYFSTDGYVSGNYLALTYTIITLAELWVSAVGLSMIGLYCDNKHIAFAMGIWYLANSLSSTLSGSLAAFSAIPTNMHSIFEKLSIYQHYYFAFGCVALIMSLLMYAVAKILQLYVAKKGIVLV